MNSLNLNNDVLTLAIKTAQRAEKSVHWQGVWARDLAYKTGALVRHQKAIWLCVQACICQAPFDRSRFWVLIAETGEKSIGAPGRPGQKGDPGQPGKPGNDGRDGIGIKSIDRDGDSLKIELTDGHVFSSGSLKGDAGKAGVGIAGIQFIGDSLEIELTDGQVFSSGSLKGDPGQDGNGISNLEWVGSAIRITLDDGTEVVSGDLQGPPGVSIEGLPGIGIARVYIDRRGHLIVVYTDGREQDAGLVRPKLQAPVIATGGGSREQGGSAKSYFTTIALPAGQWTHIQHDLDLSNKNDLIMRASLIDGTEVRLGVRTIDTNSLELLSLIGRDEINISIKS